MQKGQRFVRQDGSDIGVAQDFTTFSTAFYMVNGICKPCLIFLHLELTDILKNITSNRHVVVGF